jgi:ectoine hydroxylase-related dioxygenase (phytanoyl-CoA dioxygenase family)
MREGAVLDGVSVRVVELTGAAGDVFLVHPWILHTAAPNCNPTPRMMVSARISSSGI